MKKNTWILLVSIAVIMLIGGYQLTKPKIDEIIMKESSEEEVKREKVQLAYKEEVSKQIKQYEKALGKVPYNIESNGNFITSNIDSRIINGEEYNTDIGLSSYLSKDGTDIKNAIAIIHQVPIGEQLNENDENLKAIYNVTQTINDSYFKNKSYKEFISIIEKSINDLSNRNEMKFTILDTDKQNISVQRGNEKAMNSNFLIEAGQEKVTISIHEIGNTKINKLERQPLKISNREKNILVDDLDKRILGIVNEISSQYGYEIKNENGIIYVCSENLKYQWLGIDINKRNIKIVVYLEEIEELDPLEPSFEIIRNITPIINKYLRVSLDTFKIEEDYYSMVNFEKFIKQRISSDFASNPEYDGDGIYMIFNDYLTKSILSDSWGHLSIDRGNAKLDINIYI